MLLKGGKMYEPLVRVPLLVKYPGGIHAGEVRDTLVSNVDVAPTILRQAGIENRIGDLVGNLIRMPLSHRLTGK